MGWQKQENNEWVSWAEAKIGKRVEGFYRGSDTSQFGSAYYILEDKKGKKFNVPGSGLLNWKMEQADYPQGSYIAIEFRGKEKLKAGQFKGKEANKFDVFFDQAKSKMVSPSQPVVDTTTLESFLEND